MPAVSRSTTRAPMPLHTEVAHWFMIIATGGLWLPVYLAGKRARRSTTTYETL